MTVHSTEAQGSCSAAAGDQASVRRSDYIAFTLPDPDTGIWWWWLLSR